MYAVIALHSTHERTFFSLQWLRTCVYVCMSYKHTLCYRHIAIKIHSQIENLFHIFALHKFEALLYFQSAAVLSLKQGIQIFLEISRSQPSMAISHGITRFQSDIIRQTCLHRRCGNEGTREAATHESGEFLLQPHFAK